MDLATSWDYYTATVYSKCKAERSISHHLEFGTEGKGNNPPPPHSQATDVSIWSRQRPCAMAMPMRPTISATNPLGYKVKQCPNIYKGEILSYVI